MAQCTSSALAPPAPSSCLGFRQKVGGDPHLSLVASSSRPASGRTRVVITLAGSDSGRHSRSKLREKEERRWERENDRVSDDTSKSNKLVKVGDGAVTVDFKNAGNSVKSIPQKIKKAHRKAMKKLNKKVDKAITGFNNGGNKPVSMKTGVTRTAQPSGYYNRSGVGYAAPPPWIGGLIGWGVLFAAAWAVTKLFGLGGGGRGGGFQLPSFGSKRKRPRGSGPGRWVTDRSMGGREVWVEDIYSGRGPRGSALSEDLTYVDPSRSEAASKRKAKEEYAKQKEMKNRIEMKEPQWWQRPQPGYCPPTQKEDRVTNARRILAQLSAKRVSGSSYTAADLADLRDACSLANASVSDKVRPESAKTGIFKAGVEFALDATAKRSQTGIIGDPVVFLSGLSEDVGVTPGKAGRLVSAAVAARLRADLLQAAAQRRTGEDGGAMMTLDGAIGVLQTFPFPKDAPELEMIAGGLKTRLSDGEREWLSNTFKSIGGGAVSDTVDEALGVGK